MTSSVVESPSRAACLVALRRLGEATVSDLALAAGLSRPTAESALASLTDLGLVEHLADRVQPHRGGGRPARASTFRPDRGCVAGVDLVGQTVKVAVSDLAGRWLGTGPAVTPVPTGDHPSLEPVAEAVAAALDAVGVDPGQLRAVGVGVSGVASEDGTMVTSPLVAPWVGRNIGDGLSALLDAPVTLDNDLTLAAIAEHRMGALHGVGTAVYVQTWPHVSARILIGGEVVRGRSRVAGEVGGVRSFSDAVPLLRGPFLDDLAFLDDVLRRLREAPDDAELLDLRDRFVAGMTPSVTALVLAVDPDVVVLGGELGHHADLLAPHLERAMRDFIVNGPSVEPTFVGAALVDDGVLLGAIDQAFTRFPADIYGVAGVAPPTQEFRHG